jgi:hypothetical protein
VANGFFSKKSYIVSFSIEKFGMKANTGANASAFIGEKATLSED